MRTVYTAPGRTACAEVEVSILQRLTYTVVRLRGDIDIATAPAVRVRLLGVPRFGVRLLILDLSEVSFCDAAGLGVLISTKRRATLLGITLRLTNPSLQVAKLLRINGLDRSLAIYRRGQTGSLRVRLAGGHIRE
jgi:anti-anti-sigma factor